MSEKSIDVLRSQLNESSAFGIFHVEDVIPVVIARDAAWSAYWKAYARLDYEENEGRDPDAELVARQAHNVARDALVVMGVDPELLG